MDLGHISYEFDLILAMNLLSYVTWAWAWAWDLVSIVDFGLISFLVDGPLLEFHWLRWLQEEAMDE